MTRPTCLLGVVSTIVLGTPARAQNVKPYVIFDIDTSGSMLSSICGGGGGVDDSAECPGNDSSCVSCMAQGCDNGIADDSRLWKVKRGITDVVSSFGEATYALARYHQNPATFNCPSGGWVGSCAGADILVPFSEDNQWDILEWVDLCDNYPTTGDCDPSPVSDPPGIGCNLCPDCGSGCDKELRGAGPTPIAASMAAVGDYLINSVMPADPVASCRPYVVVQLTDGGETCGGDPVGEAANVCNAGIPVYVIGFASPALQPQLDAIADAGCDSGCDPYYGTPAQICRDTAILTDNETDLALAFGEIIQGSVLTELCNGQDDDCDGVTDNGDPGSGGACQTGLVGVCAAGIEHCVSGGLACEQQVQSSTEVCNALDDDCDGATDGVSLPDFYDGLEAGSANWYLGSLWYRSALPYAGSWALRGWWTDFSVGCSTTSSAYMAVGANVAGATSATLEFRSQATLGSLDTLTVLVSTNGGASWASIATISASAAWTLRTVSLTPYLASPTIRVAFRFYNGCGDSAGVDWRIDEVFIRSGC